jgi:hypothetical protein
MAKSTTRAGRNKDKLTAEWEEKYQEMKNFCIQFDDLPDGAFFGMAEELHSWNVDDWEWYSKEWKRRKDSYKPKKSGH